MLNRIDVENDPVNWFDPWGLAKLTVYATQRIGHPVIALKIGTTGHASVLFESDDGTKLSVGAYPFGLVEDEKPSSTAASFTWAITQEEVDKGIAATEEFGKWTWDENNCVDMVEDVFDATNIEHPSFDTYGVSDPDKVYNWLKKQ